MDHISKRLDCLGVDEVRRMQRASELPTSWAHYIREWLVGKQTARGAIESGHGLVKFNQIAFCTTCKNRAQHLKLTLPQNLADNPNSLFIVLDYNSQDDLVEYLKTNHAADIECGRLVVYSNRQETTFRMAHAKNMAHRLGIMNGAHILVNLDADNLTGPGFEEFIAWKFKQPGIFLWSNAVKGITVRGISGRIAVTASSFVKAGGYDEKYETWSPDDKDFNLRLRKIGYVPVEVEQVFLKGVPHNDRMRFREYKHVSRVGEDEFRIDTSTVTRVAPNNGSYGCGTVFKNFDFTKPIVLKPLANKIFCIGMHKTATTSLHHALEILGFDSWHWSSAHVAKAIWREMNNTGTSPTVDRYDALGDLPIPLLYRQLDRAYPGSKFILTLRDEQSWLAAVSKHFDSRYNRFRDGWSKDPFTNRIHQVLYGRQDFDADVFAERYRRHNREVVSYFENRQNDFLTMEIGKDTTGWKSLCGFLDVPHPKMNYPQSYVNGDKNGNRKENPTG